LLDHLCRAGYRHEFPVAVRFFDSWQMGVLRVAGLSAAVAGVALLRLFRNASEALGALAGATAAASALIAPPLRTVRADLYEGRSATAHKLLELGGPSKGRWRVWTDVRKFSLPEATRLNPDEERLVGFREAALPQLQEIDGIDGAAMYFSATDVDYAAVLKDAPDAGLDILGIRFYVVPPGPDMPARAIRSESGFGILERPPSPRAFIVYATRPATEASMLRSINVFEEAMVPPDGPLLHGSGRPAAVALRRAYPEQIEASVQADGPGLLVVSEHYDPGWRAEVDGRDAPLYRTDLIVLGIPVPAGRHEVRLTFRPEGFAVGAACAVLTAVVLGMLALRRRACAPVTGDP